MDKEVGIAAEIGEEVSGQYLRASMAADVLSAMHANKIGTTEAQRQLEEIWPHLKRPHDPQKGGAIVA